MPCDCGGRDCDQTWALEPQALGGLGKGPATNSLAWVQCVSHWPTDHLGLAASRGLRGHHWERAGCAGACCGSAGCSFGGLVPHISPSSWS